MTPQEQPDSQAGDEQRQQLLSVVSEAIHDNAPSGKRLNSDNIARMQADIINACMVLLERLATEARQATLTEVYHRTPTPEMVWKTLNADRLRQEWADMNRYLEQRLGINQPGRPNNE